MTGIAAAGVSRTPAISTADALHAFYRILHQPNSMACMQAAALPAGARTGICRASQQQAGKKDIHRAR